MTFRSPEYELSDQLTTQEIAFIQALALAANYNAANVPIGIEVWEENLTPQGPGTAFTLAHTPKTGTVRLYRGGSRQALVATDYSIVGSAITLTVSLAAGEVLIADYKF